MSDAGGAGGGVFSPGMLGYNGPGSGLGFVGNYFDPGGSSYWSGSGSSGAGVGGAMTNAGFGGGGASGPGIFLPRAN